MDQLQGGKPSPSRQIRTSILCVEHFVDEPVLAVSQRQKAFEQLSEDAEWVLRKYELCCAWWMALSSMWSPPRASSARSVLSRGIVDDWTVLLGT